MPGAPASKARRIWPLLIVAVFMASAALCARPAGIRIAIDATGLSVEMSAAFIEIAFDFGQARPNTNSPRGLAR